MIRIFIAAMILPTLIIVTIAWFSPEPKEICIKTETYWGKGFQFRYRRGSVPEPMVLQTRCVKYGPNPRYKP